MDEKTLEYMGERVDRARDLVEMIEVQQKRLSGLSLPYRITVATNRTDFVLRKEDGEIFNSLVEEVKRLTEIKIVELQKELEEL